jgi:hypothetical protein
MSASGRSSEQFWSAMIANTNGIIKGLPTAKIAFCKAPKAALRGKYGTVRLEPTANV